VDRRRKPPVVFWARGVFFCDRRNADGGTGPSEEMPDKIGKASSPVLQQPFNFAKLAPSVREAIAAR